MFNKSVFCTIILIAYGILCCDTELIAQKIHRSQLELNPNKDDEYYGRTRILLPNDTIQLNSTEIKGDIFDSYYDGKSFVLITVDKSGTYVLDAGEKISGKWLHDLWQYYLNADDSGMCRIEILGIQIIDGFTILVQKKYRGRCFRKREKKEFSLANDEDEPGNPNGLSTSILRICKDGIRFYTYIGKGFIKNDYGVAPASNRPDK